METTLTKNRRMFDILEDVKAYEELLIENAQENEGEISPELEIWEKEFFDELMKKTDRTVEFILFVDGEANRTKTQADLLKRKQKALETLAKKVRKNALGIMLYTNQKVLTGEHHELSVVNNGGLPSLEFLEPYAAGIQEKSFPIYTGDAADIPEKYFKTIRVLDKESIREDLKNGESAGIAILKRGQSLRIK